MKRLLYIFLIPLYVIEWFLVLFFNLLEILVNSVKELAEFTQTYINADTEFGNKEVKQPDAVEPGDKKQLPARQRS